MIVKCGGFQPDASLSIELHGMTLAKTETCLLLAFRILVALGGASIWNSSFAQTNAPASLGSSAPNAGEQEFLGQVGIGGGRRLYLECHGTGAPALILESGYHDSSQPWSLSDAHPPPVLPGVAGFTKVCTYDRPGTLLYTDPPRITDRTRPAQMPRTAGDVVSDLHALLAAARVPGPYILVGHSLGGLFVRPYAQTYPGQVVGLVLVDAFPLELPAQLGSQWPAYRQVLNNPLPQFSNNAAFEQIDVDKSITQITQAPPLRQIPLVVLTKTEPFARPSNVEGFSFTDVERFSVKDAGDMVKLGRDRPPHLRHR